MCAAFSHVDPACVCLQLETVDFFQALRLHSRDLHASSRHVQQHMAITEQKTLRINIAQHGFDICLSLMRVSIALIVTLVPESISIFIRSMKSLGTHKKVTPFQIYDGERVTDSIE